MTYHGAQCAPQLRKSLPFIARITLCLTALLDGLVCGKDTASFWYANEVYTCTSLSTHMFGLFMYCKLGNLHVGKLLCFKFLRVLFSPSGNVAKIIYGV